MQLSPEMVHSNASEEAVAWFDVNLCEPQPGAGSGEACNRSISWSPPPVGSVKCNVGVSWGGPERLCGASWIIRNQAGRVLMHSRRAFTGVKSKLEAELTGFCWIDKFTQVMPSLAPCSVEYVLDSRNRAVEEISVSVPRDRRLQSYVAAGGPRWLMNLLELKARKAGP
ncbi:hypothetical protein Bca4012_043363 [Brassica carinata]